MVNFNFASIIFDDFLRFVRNGSYESDGIRVVKLGTPTMTVARTLNNKPVEIMLEQSNNFPEITEADLEALKDHVTTNWVSVSKAYASGFNAEDSVNLTSQNFLNSYYEEEIANVLAEYNLTLPVVINEGEVVTSYVATINPSFLLPNGTLFVGTGIPGSKYSIAKNDFIELALASHRRGQSDAGRTIVDNVSTLALANATEAWNITWSVGSTHEEITDITEMYDVELVFYTNNDGTKNNSFVWKLIRDEATVSKYALQFMTDLGVAVPNVTDSKGDADKRCVQNSTRLDWFRLALAQPVPAPAAVEGRFVAVLRATHKVTGNTISVEHVTVADWAGNN